MAGVRNNCPFNKPLQMTCLGRAAEACKGRKVLPAAVWQLEFRGWGAGERLRVIDNYMTVLLTTALGAERDEMKPRKASGKRQHLKETFKDKEGW